jgi:Ca2+-binding RTX toxin-like protein
MMEPTRNEVGVGIATGDWNYPGYGILDSYAQSAETATDGSIFLTGVAYTDAVANDDFYTPGEGLAGIVITATRLSDNAIFTASTWASGGYSLELTAGTYNVKATGAGLGATIYNNNVVIGTQNVKRDFVVGQTSDPIPETEIFAKVTDRVLVVTGTTLADIIGVSSNGVRYAATMNGSTLTYRVTLIDQVAVLGNEGNDTIVIGDNVLFTYIEGGEGKDHITGGAGGDYITAGTQNDWVNGAGGDDTLVTAGGNDFIYGGDGDDLLAGAVGRDVLYGEIGADVLNGGRHTDYSDNEPDDTRISIEVLA